MNRQFKKLAYKGVIVFTVIGMVFLSAGTSCRKKTKKLNHSPEMVESKTNDASLESADDDKIDCKALEKKIGNTQPQCESKERRLAVEAITLQLEGCVKKQGRCCYDIPTNLSLLMSNSIIQQKKKGNKEKLYETSKDERCKLLKRSCELKYWPGCVEHFQVCSGDRDLSPADYDSFARRNKDLMSGLKKMCRDGDNMACHNLAMVNDYSVEVMEKGRERDEKIEEIKTAARAMCKSPRKTSSDYFIGLEYLIEYSINKNDYLEPYNLAKKWCYEESMGNACYSAFELAISHFEKGFDELFDLRYRFCLHAGGVDCVDRFLPECKGTIKKKYKKKCAKIPEAARKHDEELEKSMKNMCPITLEEIKERFDFSRLDIRLKYSDNGK